jgi:hypothetical protein
MEFNLERFEYLAYSRKHEEAARELLDLLKILDKNYSVPGSEFSASAEPSMQSSPELADLNIFTRIAAAISVLFADPGFNFSAQGFGTLVLYHRWLALLFAISPFRNADHIIFSLNQNGHNPKQLSLHDKDWFKFCLLLSPESNVNIDFEALWKANKVVAANLFLALMTPRFLASSAATAKREALLRWLPGRLEEIDDLDQLPMGVLHDVYLNCSYSGYEGKHNIKRSINTLIRRKIGLWGIEDNPAPARMPASGKPVMLVVLEWFNANHSVYRVLSKAMRQMREQFHLIGMGAPAMVDETGRGVFDEFIEIENQHEIKAFLEQVSRVARERDAQVLYMPSVGMLLITMFLSNLRVAPLQITTLGHSASTFAPQMDYFVIDEDFVGDEACFSEKVIKMPVDAFPFIPSINTPETLAQAPMREAPEVVQVAMAASTMKLNPEFLQACRKIADQSATPVHFNFFIGFATGLMYKHVEQVIKSHLGGRVTIHAHQSYADYLQKAAACDLYINPFPFGNMNGIVDMMSLGLVGVCKSGREPHEHIDQGLFERLGMPGWLVTKSTEAYINAALRLINNHGERLKIRAHVGGYGATRRLFEGRPELFGQAVQALHLAAIAQSAASQPGDALQSQAGA